MTPAEFDAIFDRPWAVARKLETRRRYVAPGEDERIRAFEEGAPRPVRSVRTDPWLARVATTTAKPGKAGKLWQRIRIHDHPETPYQQYGLPGLIESQAVGEDVRIALRSAVPGLERDFWWFDPGTLGEFAVVTEYDEGDVFLGAHQTADPLALGRCAADWDLALRWSVSLNDYLAAGGKAERAA